MAITYAKVDGVKHEGNPRPRLDSQGYTLRGGSPTTYKVLVDGRWRRVYCLQFSNAASFFCRVNGERKFINSLD